MNKLRLLIRIIEPSKMREMHPLEAAS